VFLHRIPSKAFSKTIGKLWTLDNVMPFRKAFQIYYFDDMGHDLCKITACGAGNVEFELVQPCRLAAGYLVNNCPGCPQLEAWGNASIKEIVRQYPLFAYIKKM